MSKILYIIGLFLINSFIVHGQSFEYEYSNKWIYVKPLSSDFEKSTKKMGLAYLNSEYQKDSKTFIVKILNDCLTYDQIQKINSNIFLAQVYFDSEGNIVHLEFIFKKGLEKYIKEENLQCIYNNVHKKTFKDNFFVDPRYGKKYFKLNFRLMTNKIGISGK